MATKNRIAYALPIIQIMKILSAKSHKQMRLRLIYRERVGIITNPKEKEILELRFYLRFSYIYKTIKINQLVKPVNFYCFYNIAVFSITVYT